MGSAGGKVEEEDEGVWDWYTLCGEPIEAEFWVEVYTQVAYLVGLVGVVAYASGLGRDKRGGVEGRLKAE